MWADEVLSTDYSIKLIEDEATSLSSFLSIPGSVTSVDSVLTYTGDYFAYLKKYQIIQNQETSQTVQILEINEDDTIEIDVPINDSDWEDVEIAVATQQKKIDLAKTRLADKLRISLRRNKYKEINEDEDVLDSININSSLKLASDYLVLKMIYSDLQENSNDYKNKYNQYSNLLDEAYRDALELIELDIDDRIVRPEFVLSGVVTKW